MRSFKTRSMWTTLACSTTALAVMMGGCPVGDPDIVSGQTGGTGQNGGTGQVGGTGQTGGSGQSGGTPANAAPTVSAGADQTVAGGEAVSLLATASDPEGGALTYAWTQIAGAAVALSAPAAASTSFSAPFASGTLSFRVVVTDPQGAVAADIVDVEVKVEPMLFISSFAGGNVTSYANPALVNGNIAPETNLAGAATQIATPADIVVDSKGALIVANYGANRITGYDDAPTTNGNLAPDRNVSGLGTGLAGPVSMAIDAAADLLFVANAGGAPDNIAIFADASKPSLNGNLAPTRQIFNAAITNPTGINLDSAGSLYIANGASNVLVYADAGNLNGNVAPTRIITSPAFAGGNVFDVFVDHEDRLYVVSSGADRRIFKFDNASTLNGAAMPDSILTVPTAVAMYAIVVDKQGVGYLTDPIAHAVYSFDDIATLNGSLAPDRTISGASTQLNQPIRMFLLER